MNLNDYFARTYLQIRSPQDRCRLRRILSVYDSNEIKKLFIARDYDPVSSLALHIENKHKFSKHIQCASNNTKITVISVIPLIKGISTTKNISRLAFISGDDRYIFIQIPPISDPDIIISELHRIIYKLNLIPVITSFASTIHTIPERAAKSLFNIPHALYQIDIGSIRSKTTVNLVRKLLDQNKNVIFGTGTRFDSCPLENSAYYDKLIKRSVGNDYFGYFTLRHNHVFH